MPNQLNEDNAIPLEWIKNYTDEFLKIRNEYHTSIIGPVILERVSIIYDLVEAYKKRNIPIDKR